MDNLQTDYLIRSKEDLLVFVVLAIILLGVFILSVAFKDYSSRFQMEASNKPIKWLFRLACIFTAVWIIGHIIAKTPEADAWAGMLFLWPMVLWLFWILAVLTKVCSGYRFQDEQLVFHRWYIKHTITQEDIGNIVLSTARGRYGYLFGKRATKNRRDSARWPYPFITLESSETIQLCTMVASFYKGEISSFQVYEYSKSYNHFLYGFLYDPNNPPDWIFENYKGKLYITFSILALYVDEMFAFLEKNGIRKEQVTIIRDRSDYTYFAREVDESYVDRRIKEYYGNAALARKEE